MRSTLLMTPGLAIFYGGMVRITGVLNMIMMSFVSIPLVTATWLLVAYTIAFSEDGAGGLIATSDMSGCSASALTPPTAQFPNCLPRHARLALGRTDP